MDHRRGNYTFCRDIIRRGIGKKRWIYSIILRFNGLTRQKFRRNLGEGVGGGDINLEREQREGTLFNPGKVVLFCCFFCCFFCFFFFFFCVFLFVFCWVLCGFLLLIVCLGAPPRPPPPALQFPPPEPPSRTPPPWPPDPHPWPRPPPSTLPHFPPPPPPPPGPQHPTHPRRVPPRKHLYRAIVLRRRIKLRTR